MKQLLLTLCLVSQIAFGQDTTTSNFAATHSIDSVQSPDSIPLYNSHGQLLKDDPLYNPRYAWWKVSARVLTTNVVNWAIAKYVYKFDWPSSGPKDWKRNFQRSPVWDEDRFSLNFVGHPHTGNFYFNTARANGYSFWGSLPFALQGSLTWEWLGEKDPPSWNDLINTPVSGAFLGEVAYRISSNILDDSKRGGARVFREIVAGIINPPRAFNRLTQGKMFRVVHKEVYQKEPLAIQLSAGVHKVNNVTGKANQFATGDNNAMLNLQLDYGDPYEIRSRKPFDVFRLRVELSYGADSNLLDNVTGYGLLAGKTVRLNRTLFGLFQHFDYWRNNNVFELGALAFGPGLLGRYPLGPKSNLNSVIHLAAVPLAGNSTQFGPQQTELRDYNFGGGALAKLEEYLSFNNRLHVGFTSYAYFVHTYKGIKGNSFTGIIKPTVALRIVNNMHIGFEHHIYYNHRNLDGAGDLSLSNTEQKLYLQWRL